MKDANSAKQSHSYLPHAAIPSRVVIWAILTGLGIALPVLCLSFLIPLPPQDARMMAAATQRAAQVFVSPWALALQALVVYPLLEEGFYRGVILQMLRRYLPLWVAVLVPTFIFGVTHMGFSLRNAAFAFVVGLYFAWLAIRSHSLYPSILCHSAINFAVVFVFGPILTAREITTPTAMRRPLSLLMLAGSLIIFVAGIRILHGEFKRRSSAVAA